MEKINYQYQQPFVAAPSALEKLWAKAQNSSPKYSKLVRIVTRPATMHQLRVLTSLGIFPKWEVTEMEADEMIINSESMINSAFRNSRPSFDEDHIHKVQGRIP